MASWTQWTWIWANSRRWWRPGKPGMLQSTGLRRIRHDLTTEQQQQLAGFMVLRRSNEPSAWAEPWEAAKPELAQGLCIISVCEKVRKIRIWQKPAAPRKHLAFRYYGSSLRSQELSLDVGDPLWVSLTPSFLEGWAGDELKWQPAQTHLWRTGPRGRPGHLGGRQQPLPAGEFGEEAYSSCCPFRQAHLDSLSVSDRWGPQGLRRRKPDFWTGSSVGRHRLAQVGLASSRVIQVHV